MYSRPAAIDQVGADFDVAGHIDTALLERTGVSRNSDFYQYSLHSSCRTCAMGLGSWGVVAENVHTEIFGALEGITPAWRRLFILLTCYKGHLDLAPQSHSRVAGLPPRGIRKFASLLELAEACDVPVRWSCRTGVCHTCMTGLISGSIIYNPEPLESSAPGNVLVCCSQPNAGVTLDL